MPWSPPTDTATLEDLLSEPPALVVESLRNLPGDFLILGVAGKMGPSLARMVKRAGDLAGKPRRVTGVARFTSAGQEAALQAQGIETLRGDLLDEDFLARLPEAPNVIFMAGMKFGSTGAEAATWAMNSYLPGLVARRFHRSRIVAFSTGNIYGLVPVEEGGSRETDAPQPVGEYAMSCLGRERVFEHFSRFHETPMALIRLNYACDLRYGVLVDLAQQVWAGHPVDVTMGYFNTIWQGDANAMTLLALAHVAAPPFVVNVTGPERLSVREVCTELGRLMHRKVSFVGAEAPNALLSDASTAIKLFGPPKVSAQELVAAVAHWVMRGGVTLGKPTHFESRDGRF
jgi:nucleoside-diphosphate-sugar epimerase